MSRPPTGQRTDLFLTRGLESQKGAAIFRSQHVQKTIRTLPHVPDALLQILQHRFAPQLFPFVAENNALQLPRAWDAPLTQAGDERVAFPVWKTIAGIKRHTCETD